MDVYISPTLEENSVSLMHTTSSSGGVSLWLAIDHTTFEIRSEIVYIELTATNVLCSLRSKSRDRM